MIYIYFNIIIYAISYQVFWTFGRVIYVPYTKQIYRNSKNLITVLINGAIPVVPRNILNILLWPRCRYLPVNEKNVIFWIIILIATS